MKSEPIHDDEMDHFNVLRLALIVLQVHSVTVAIMDKEFARKQVTLETRVQCLQFKVSICTII